METLLDLVLVPPVESTVTLRREGFCRWHYRAFGELGRAVNTGSLVLLPVPGAGTTLGEGLALTAWGARRKARRAIRMWGRH